jgi:hypothetical protein
MSEPTIHKDACDMARERRCGVRKRPEKLSRSLWVRQHSGQAWQAQSRGD